VLGRVWNHRIYHRDDETQSTLMCVVVAIGLNVVNGYAYHNRLASGTLSLVRRWCPALEKSFDRLRLVTGHHFHY